MAKLTRLLLGGVFGAGLAYLFSRKDVRNRLMGGGRPQLPSAEGPQVGFCPTAAAPVSAPVDLESRTEETRRQLEEQLEEPVTAPAKETREEIDVAEAPEILLEAEAIVAPVEENMAVETAPEIENAPAIESLETSNEVAAEQAVPETVTPVETVTPAEPAATKEGEFIALGTPVEGEPTTGEETPARPDAEADTGGPVPSQIDREEMRRRIDETRARLKAKAFDAMISGETFIEPETEEAVREKKSGSETRIDKDLEEQIDRSLKEED
ncbi:MAG: hypothetical protein ACYDGS_09355 [Thermoleophilia bacterium]